MENCYIVRATTSRLLCFFYLKSKGIICKSFEQNKWGKDICIIENTRAHFTVSFDKNGFLYLFCQDEKGHIILLTNASGKWTKKTILANQSNKIHTISIHPIMSKTELSIIYNIPSQSGKFQEIANQSLGANGQWSTPKVIDKFLPLNQELFKVQHVTDEHVLIFYHMRNKENILGYKEFTPQLEGEFVPFHSTNYQITDSSNLTTNDGVHVLYIVKSGFSAQLIYRQKTKESFDNQIIICEAQNIDNCTIFFVKERLYITFINNGQLYYSHSENMGQTFSSPIRYKNKICLNPVKANYISFVPQSVSDLFCLDIYVDATNLWDVQILPDLYEDFYTCTEEAHSNQPTIQPNNRHSNIKNNQFQQNTSDYSELQIVGASEKIFLLESQLALAKKQLADKNEEISRLRALNEY